MLRLEDVNRNSYIQGILGDKIVRIVQIERLSENSITVYYKDDEGKLGEQLLTRVDEERLNIAKLTRPWSFEAAGKNFKLGLEAYRISQAALFDPMMAIYTSNVDPLPHQISAVYEAMLPRQPLRFVLADDPGAGKTIMAGLLIKELMMRSDAERVLIISPGSLTEQWQDELYEKFGISFEIFSREKQEQSISGNFFAESDRLICRLDQLSRNEEYQEKLKSTDWDIIIVDEAHKLSASYFGNEIKKTKRFLLGELLRNITRHFLLMTATPHNGKEQDFQTWLSLLDADRFFGKSRQTAETKKIDVSDIMRRMVKEDLLKFDGTRLFPERRAYTANYDLSSMESQMYERVSDYVRHEMNKADQLSGQQKNNVGFALTILQRRLASSPEAIYQSLKRRRKRLEERLNDLKNTNIQASSQGNHVAETLFTYSVNKQFDLPENFDEIEDELSAEELEQLTEQMTEEASSSETEMELASEIEILKGLEEQAHNVVLSGNDKKWEQLSSLLQEQPEMYTANGQRRKLIIFTEHKDTLNYLVNRIQNLIGNPGAVRTISGSSNRDERRKTQEEFRHNPEVLVLIATDAAGEGVNLQNANLMVNYDLPWNPNRLEQRFGRIHRIGQTEVCHLWNLVANQTREGLVFQRLFDKIEAERRALGGKVFDVLGEAFDNVSLKELLIDAIRYGEQPDVKAKMHEIIDNALDINHLKEVISRNALAEQNMGIADLYAIKEEMEKAQARKLQPYFIRAFFNEAFGELGGFIKPQESHRYEIKHVPAKIREYDKRINETRTPVLTKYERICFEKQFIRVDGKPMAELLQPMHPLVRAVTLLTLDTYRATLKQGTILVDEVDDSNVPKMLFIIDHSIKEAEGKEVSRRIQFVKIDAYGNASNAGWAPHLDLEPIIESDKALIADVLDSGWITTNPEHLALNYASHQLVPEHFTEVKTRREQYINKVELAVKKRLLTEIDYLTESADKLQEQVKQGKQPKVQVDNVDRRIDELSARLNHRLAELKVQKDVVSSTPVVIGGALIIPAGLLAERQGSSQFTVDALARKRIETLAMQAVMQAEESLGYETKDVSAEKCGWDITSRPPIGEDGAIPLDRHIEVKGRAKGQSTITVSRNEIVYALNQADKFILAIVIVDGDKTEGPFYIRNPFTVEPDFAVASVNYDLADLLSRAVSPQQMR